MTRLPVTLHSGWAISLASPEGFAAETNDVVANAEKKLVSKHADLVVANEVGGGRAFGADDNVVWFVDDQDVEELPRMSKTRLADEILNKAMQFLA